MNTKRKAKSPILEAVYETATDLKDIGFINIHKMHKYDALCLEPVRYTIAARSKICVIATVSVKQCSPLCSIQVCRPCANGKSVITSQRPFAQAA